MMMRLRVGLFASLLLVVALAHAQGSARTTGTNAANQTVDATNTTNVTSTVVTTPNVGTSPDKPRITGTLGADAVRDSVQTFNLGAACAANTASWGVNPNLCTAVLPATGNGYSLTLVDDTAPFKGTLNMQCTNGVWQGSTWTCGAPCPDTVVSWTVGPFSCSGPVPATLRGNFVVPIYVRDTIAPTTGYAYFQCNSNGSWSRSPTTYTNGVPNNMSCESSAPLPMPAGVVYGVFQFALGPVGGGPINYMRGVGYYKPSTGQFRGHFFYEQLGISSVVPATDSCAFSDATMKNNCIVNTLCREIPLSPNVYGPLPYCNIYGGGYTQPGTIIMTKTPGTVPYNIVIAVDEITIYAVTTVIPMGPPTYTGTWATSPPAW